MTPVLVIFFNISPAAAISSDVVTSLILKPFGGTVHVRNRAVLVVAAAGVVTKLVLAAKRTSGPITELMDPQLVRPLPTMIIGAVGGLIVGMTSVGSGSLITVALTLLYPKLSSKEMVGTDLVQAIPLVGAAALGHAIFGTPRIELIASVLLGAIRPVVLGAQLWARASDRYIRPVLCGTLTISALKLLVPSKNAFNGQYR